jgi:hypothetical protein
LKNLSSLVKICKLSCSYILKSVSISSRLKASESIARMLWAAGRAPSLPVNRVVELTAYGDPWEVWGDCDNWGANWERLGTWDGVPVPTTSVLRLATMTAGCWLCTASLNVTSCFSSSSILLWDVSIMSTNCKPQILPSFIDPLVMSIQLTWNVQPCTSWARMFWRITSQLFGLSFRSSIWEGNRTLDREGLPLTVYIVCMPPAWAHDVGSSSPDYWHHWPNPWWCSRCSLMELWFSEIRTKTSNIRIAQRFRSHNRTSSLWCTWFEFGEVLLGRSVMTSLHARIYGNVIYTTHLHFHRPFSKSSNKIGSVTN